MKTSFRYILVLFLASGTLSAVEDKPKLKAPALDVFTATLTGNLEALKQHAGVGTNFNAREPKGGSTPLMLAALVGQLEPAKFIVSEGADLDLKNSRDGGTALHVAAFFGYTEVVALLLEKGANLNIRNKAGNTPLDQVDVEWSPQLEEVYQFVGTILQIKLDLARIKKARPEIASMIRKKGGKLSKELK